MSAFHSLRADTGCDYTPDPSSQSRAILEKKWTTVIRLQKKEYLSISFLSLAAHSSLSLYRSLILNPATRLSRTIYPPHPQNVPITPTGFLEIHPHIPSPATVPPLPRSPSIHSIPSWPPPVKTPPSRFGIGRLANSREPSKVTPNPSMISTLTTRAISSVFPLSLSLFLFYRFTSPPHQSLAPPTSSSRYGILNPSTKTQRPSLATNIPSLPFASCQAISTSSAPAETRPSDYSTFHQRTHSLVLFPLHPPGSFSFQPPNPHHFWPFRMGPMRYPFFRWQNHRQLFQRPSPLPPCSSPPFTLPSPSCIYIDHQNLGSPHRRAETRIQRS